MGFLWVAIMAAIIPVFFGAGRFGPRLFNWIIGGVLLIVGLNALYWIAPKDTIRALALLDQWDRAVGGPGKLDWYVQAYWPYIVALVVMWICQGWHMAIVAKRRSA